MESFSILCTTCRTRLKVRSEEALGKILGCPKCGGMVQVPTELAELRAASLSNGDAAVTAVNIPALPHDTPASASSIRPAPAPASAPSSLFDNDFDVVNDLLADQLREPPVAVPAKPAASPVPPAPPVAKSPSAAPSAQPPAAKTAAPAKPATTPAPAPPATKQTNGAPGQSGTKLPSPAKSGTKLPAPAKPAEPPKATTPVTPAASSGAKAAGASGIQKAAAAAPKAPSTPPEPKPAPSPAVTVAVIAAPPAPPVPAPTPAPPPEPSVAPESAEAAPTAEFASPAPNAAWVSPTMQKWRPILIYAAAGIGGVVLAIVLLLLAISSFSKPEVADVTPQPPVDPMASPMPAPPSPTPMTTPPADPPGPMLPADPPMPATPTLPPVPPVPMPMPGPEPTPPVPAPGPMEIDPTPMPADPPPAEFPDVPKPPPRPELPALDVTARLNDKIPGLQLPPTPLVDFAEFLGEFSTLPIGIDPQSLRLAGINARAPVTIDVTDSKVQAVLEKVLAEKRLALRIGERHVTIVHPWQLDAKPREDVAHDIGDLAGSDPASIAALRELAFHLAAPNLAEGASDAGSVKTTGSKISAKQPMLTQIELLRFFERLRMARGKTALNPLAKSQPNLFKLDPPALASAKLATPISLNFVQPTRLAQVLARLRTASGATVLADWAALADERIAPTTEVILSTEGVPLSEALTQLATPLGITWRLVDDETVLLTTLAAAGRFDNERTVEFRKVGKLAKDDAAAAALLAKIEAALEDPAVPEGEKKDAFIHLDLASGYLIARLPRAQHAKLVELLTEWQSADAEE